jgi:hypothetical protein
MATSYNAKSSTGEPNYAEIEIDIRLDDLNKLRDTREALDAELKRNYAERYIDNSLVEQYNQVNLDSRDLLTLIQDLALDTSVSNDIKIHVSEYKDAVFTDIDNFETVIYNVNHLLRRTQALRYAGAIYSAHLQYNDPGQQRDFDGLQHEYAEIRHPDNVVPQVPLITQDVIDQIVRLHNDLIPQITDLLETMGYYTRCPGLTHDVKWLADEYALQNPRVLNIDDYRLDPNIGVGRRAVYEFHVEIGYDPADEDLAEFEAPEWNIDLTNFEDWFGEPLANPQNGG